MQEDVNEMERRKMVRLSNEASGRLTRECLQTALIRLLSEKDMEKITISELVRLAGVSRTAFYSNYSSKEEVLLAWMEVFVSEVTGLVSEAIRNDNLVGMHEEIFEYIYSNSDKFEILVKGNLQNNLQEKIRDVMLEKRPAPNERGKMLIGGWCGMIYEILYVWYRDGMKESVKEMAQMCGDLTGYFLKKIQEACPGWEGLNVGNS